MAICRYEYSTGGSPPLRRLLDRVVFRPYSLTSLVSEPTTNLKVRPFFDFLINSALVTTHVAYTCNTKTGSVTGLIKPTSRTQVDTQGAF